METKNEFVANTAVHPGNILKLELEEREIKQKDFAERLGIAASNLNEYIKGKRGFSAEFSLKLEDLLGIPASNWMNLQKNYELIIARKRRLSILDRASIL